MNHVLTKEAALALGIIDQEGNELPHRATQAQVSVQSESAHPDIDAAYASVQGERWIVDSEGNTLYVDNRVQEARAALKAAGFNTWQYALSVEVYVAMPEVPSNTVLDKVRAIVTPFGCVAEWTWRNNNAQGDIRVSIP